MNGFTALFASYVLVASLGWTNGYMAGRFLERRVGAELDSWPPVPFLDLTDTQAYDWDTDTEIIWRRP
jgi:hypothetical protein